VEERVLEMKVGVDEAEDVRLISKISHDGTHPARHLIELPPDRGWQQVPAPGRGYPAVLHGVSEEGLPVPPHPDEPGRWREARGVFVQLGDHTADPRQVDRPWVRGPDPPGLPAEQREDPATGGRRGGAGPGPH